MQDLWAAGDIDTFQKKGLHFADATQDLRLSYVKRLTAMPFEGYVAFRSEGFAVVKVSLQLPMAALERSSYLRK